ncbi:MAG TPA: SNF2-related protein [Dactylosporangium sp.]|nr:SNF2-related protein [Dactylosporangium sp.]
MIVVHGLVTADGRLACWAETTDAPIPHAATTADASAAAPSAPPARNDTPSRHPFAVLPPLPGTVATTDLLLPSTQTRPAASPELSEHLPKTPGARQPQPRRQTTWTVPIVVLPPATDPEALLSAVPDVRLGSSIGYLSDVTMFATSLVDRGRVLPALVTESPSSLPAVPSPEAHTTDTAEAPPARPTSDTLEVQAGAVTTAVGRAASGFTASRAAEALTAGPAARWRPALWGADAATFESLCRAMPGVAAAATQRSREETTTAAVNTTVDALVRARLRYHPLLSEGQVRHDTVVRSWLAALTAPDARLRTAPAPASVEPSAVTWPTPRTAAEPSAAEPSAGAAAAGPSTEPAPDAQFGPRIGPTPENTPGPPSADEFAPRFGPAPEDGFGPRSGSTSVDELGPRIGAPSGDEPMPGAAAAAAAAAEQAPGAAAAGVVSRAIAEGPEVARLREIVERWADSGRPAAVRTCFRLSFVEDPDEPDDADIDPHRPAGIDAQDATEPERLDPATGAGRADTRGNGTDRGQDGQGPRSTDGASGGANRGRDNSDGRWSDGTGGPERAVGGRRTVGGGAERGHGGRDRRQDDGDGGHWLVEFLLQPAEEPGLLVPAEQVWRDKASPLFRWVDYPQDVLLADLGRASRLWPDLDDALRTPRPEVLRLDTAGAHRFLQHATLLHDAGFGVLLPAQWQRRQDLGLTLTVRARQPAAPVLRDTTANRDAIFAYRWGLAIGDEFLSKADLTALARAKVPLVRLRGRWVHLDRDRLAAGLAFLRRGGTGEMTAGEAIRLTRLVPDGDLPLPVVGVDGSGWLADLLAGRAVERLELLDPPASLTATLRPYQRRGLSWLAFLDSLGVGALLADDMGLGKTVQLLALEALARERGPRPPTLIVCPLSVLGNWRREIARFTPGLTVAVHHGSTRPGRGGVGDPAGLADADLVLTTYQVATRDVDTLAAITWDRVVLDEAQHVKNATGVTARAMRRLPARHRVALTGTPVENRLTELWSIADFLNPGLLGEASIFRARYSVPIERWSDADAARRLRRVTRPFLLRRVKTDRAVIADLPEKFERRQWCNLTLEQATLYKAVVNELFIRLREGRAGPQRKGLVLSAMTKLKQVCNHPAHLMGDGTPLPGRSGKLARLEEILTAALEAGDRALVFTQFARFGHLLVPHLAQRLATPVEFLHGGTPKGARDRMVERFQSGDGAGVLLVSLKAGGTGLNLTAANHVVHVDRWWNPAAEAQATDRAFRIGQRRDVQVHTFVCIGTIEERVEHIMASKRGLAGVAVGSGEGWLTGLSTDDLLELMSLSPEAVEDA